MEEREALKRQIELLQDLINKHKSVHGDVPFPTAQQPYPQPTTSARGRGLNTTFTHQHASRGRLNVHESRGSWRKTHSLRNKNPHPSFGHQSASTSSGAPSGAQPATHSSSEPGYSRDGKDTTKIAELTNAEAHATRTTLSPSAQSSRAKKPAPTPTSLISQTPVTESFLKKSKFTWVKSQNVGGVHSKQSTSTSSPTGKTLNVPPGAPSKAAVASGSSATVSKRTPAKKLPRKPSPISVKAQSTKYKWVSARAEVKTSRKPPSPKALTPQRALETGEATKRLRTLPSSFAKMKRAGSSSPSSRYRWKAAGQSTPERAMAGVVRAHRKSVFHWTADKSHKGARGGAFLSSSPGAYKLRSRMKIIRKSTSSGGGSERGSGASAVKYAARGRTHFLSRASTGVRRTPSRLVSLNRHKLRRVSVTSSRSSSASPVHCDSTPQRVFRTRYKMVTQPGSGAALGPHYNPALSWRTKRIQSARSFLQSRLRSTHHRHPSSAQHWRGSSMCWIGGSLYHVSANKLSRTVASNMSINRKGHPFCSQASSVTPAWNRTSSTRYLASRAVQRSLAIIRHARVKKQQKQYCMYYNRFGKCNRGTSCPYIHDPDKVAVCTRFLRGTCKQAEGTCPFSHKVAKEKMPVCSYFLKGICNNSECHYSHVYVSRKAEVCKDFVKGYCPEGEKCKKKHTLVCPDFSKTGSCPRGTRCKLQHRQNSKRNSTVASTQPLKKARHKEGPKSPQASAQQTPTPGPLALPSFISLSSSPEEPDTPDTPPAETPQVKEKRLQIKPRL